VIIKKNGIGSRFRILKILSPGRFNFKTLLLHKPYPHKTSHVPITDLPHPTQRPPSFTILALLALAVLFLPTPPKKKRAPEPRGHAFQLPTFTSCIHKTWQSFNRQFLTRDALYLADIPRTFDLQS